MGILPKNQMSEEDIKTTYITPVLFAKGWKDKITMETQVKLTDGKINIVGKGTVKEKPKKADYVLYINANNPIAIIEAKNNNHTVSHGLQQAKEYAKMLDIPFAYSSNGDAFQEFDFFTGLEREIPLDQFPTYDALFERLKKEANNGEGLSNDELAVINQPYYTSQTTHSPRYYQRIAVNRTVDLISQGRKRLLLVMATGTGKTFTAFQIIYRLLKSGIKRKILYLADRNILVDQSISQDFSPLKNTIHKINFLKDDKSTITSYEVYFSLYQQLTGGEETETTDENAEDETISKLESLFKPDFFDLVVVDECHRGSAKKDSNWRKILEYFSSATQLGMTATPKETKYVSNINYFGEPIYTYSLKNGIEDGFLAPFRVINITTNISEGWRPVKGQTDKYGNEIEDRIYDNRDYDKNIVIEDRINKVAQVITDYLKSTDRMAKTIVFCETEEHAELMRTALSNLNSDMVRKNPDYVVRITGSDVYGKSKLDYFISVSQKYPVIATTSKLLSTGVDCKMTKLIVLDQMIGSMTEFKQIVGRGTRLREKEGKTHFTIMDFRNVSRLFADPEWDGDPVIDPIFDTTGGTKPEKPKDDVVKDPEPPYKNKPFVDKDGCQVYVINKTVSVYDTNNKLLKQENIIDYTRRNIQGDYLSLENFIKNWNTASKKQIIKNLFDEHGISLDNIKNEENMVGVDDFDFICHVAFDKKPLTRKERAENVKKRDFLSKYSGVAREVLETLLNKYADSNIYEIEDLNILKLDIFKHFGTPVKIAKYFGGKDNYLKAVKDLAKCIYEVA